MMMLNITATTSPPFSLYPPGKINLPPPANSQGLVLTTVILNILLSCPTTKPFLASDICQKSNLANILHLLLSIFSISPNIPNTKPTKSPYSSSLLCTLH